jgi:signal transduction histidine kinase
VVGLYQDKQGNLWAGVMNGFWRWKPGPSIFYPVPDALDGIRAFVEGDDGGLLFSTRSGINRLMNGKIEPCSLPGTLQHLRVMRMLRDRNGGLWLGTWNGGIVHIHNGRSDTDSNGLTGIDVVALFEDREGDIWAVTSTGLDRFRESGVNKLPPPVRIEQITADGKIYDALNGLRLPAHVRDLAIDYTALSLVAPEKIHFRYKLEGQDPNWREVVNDHRVQYSNLPPGDYRFRVTASNNSGIWNPTGASLNFNIAPAYYETVWFRASCTVAIAVLLLALVTGIYTYRKDVTRKENERIERLRQAQTDLDRASRVITMGELAASLAHEIKQPIGAAVTNAEVCFRLLDRDQPDLPEAREAALEMMRDARRAADIIEHVRSVYRKGSSAQEIVDVNEVIREMVAMLQKEADRHSVRMSTDIAAEPTRVMADRVQLQQALMNLMRNGIEAIEDTTGELSIKSQSRENGQVLISISDTGVGLPTGNADQIFDAFFTTKSQGTGLGLAITRSIIESHGGRIWATSNSGGGATFHFTLPVREPASA